jgi:2'-phosphotransferase
LQLSQFIMPHGRGGHGGPLPRTVLISKALSRLLRHAAVDERIPIDNHGYVRMDHLLGWQRLRTMKPPVNFAEIVEVVQGNEKKRFAMKFAAGAGAGDGGNGGIMPPRTTEPITKQDGSDLDLEQAARQREPESEGQVETETQHAISQFESTPPSDLDLKRFFIRATQGHSMKTIEAENLLTPISLDDPASIPDTVVHGTFYGAWERILKSGGLKSMMRNHVHFARGPSLQEVLSSSAATTDHLSNDTRSAEIDDDGDGDGNNEDENSTKDDAQPAHQNQNKNKTKTKTNNATAALLPDLLGKNKVISGMRSDAQILIYMDIRRALTEEKDMKWWRSENGVILTDGIAAATAASETETESQGAPATAPATAPAAKVVPTKYFLAAVEIKEGVGLLYEHDAGGVVRELPERLKSRGVPRGKGGGPRRRGGGDRGGGGRGGGRGAAARGRDQD